MNFSTSSNDTLSWQSVFWAVVPIALNSMSQPSGKILGYPSTYNFVLRCSPIVCAVSAIDAWTRLLVFAIQEKSLSKALEKFVNLRFEDRQGHEDGSFHNLRTNTVFRVALFILGAVPQFVKVYATTGVPWTQAWCAAYLAPFMLDELILYAAPKEPRQQAGGTRIAMTVRYSLGGFTIYELLTRAVLWSSVGFAYGFFSHGFTKMTMLALGDFSLPRIIVFSVLSLLWLCLVALPSLEALTTVFVAVTPFTTLAVSFFTPIVLSTTLISEHLGSEWVWRIAMGLAALLALAATMISFERLLKVVAPQRAKYVHFVYGAYYILLHVLTALLYYGFVYDSFSTYKPAWTNVLG